MSTDAETDNPQTELKAGIDLLGPVDEIFFDMYDRYEPVNEPALDNCFISTVSETHFYFLSLPTFKCWISSKFLTPLPWSLQSYDATTHFETTVADVLNMYTLITGKVKFSEIRYGCMLMRWKDQISGFLDIFHINFVFCFPYVAATGPQC